MVYQSLGRLNPILTMTKLIAIITAVLTLQSGFNAHAITVRVRDKSFVLGARDNQLMGIGLVTGLANDGDKDPIYTAQSLQNVFQTFGLTVPAAQMTAKNSAVVMVTATIPPNMKSGNTIDVHVSAMGDARSIQGGVLSRTLLFGVDKEVYAIAQGQVGVGGFALGNAGAGGATVQKNHPTAGQIIGGAIVEKEIPATIRQGDWVSWVLRDQDFTTSARMAQAINDKFPNSSLAEDGTTVRVKIPDSYRADVVRFIAEVEMIEFEPDTPARIVITERTGTIVVSGRVKIATCAVSHGNLVVNIAETLDASQPNPFAQTGQTVVTAQTQVNVTEEKAYLRALPDMPTIEKLAFYLNQVGATPRDMMAIFQAMKQAGALQAELVMR